jgi:ribosomal-protein-alanine N-acetyltransferase
MSFPPFSSIGSARVTVRPVAADDLPDLFEVNGDPEVTRFLPYATWQSLADGAAWLQRMEALEATGSGRQLVLARTSDGKAIGTLLLFKHDEASRRLEIGYTLARACWGQGLMTETLRVVCEYAFSQMHLRRLEAEVNPANTASCELLRRCGFVHEGTLRQRWFGKGAVYDTSIYGLLHDDARAPEP